MRTIVRIWVCLMCLCVSSKCCTMKKAIIPNKKKLIRKPKPKLSWQTGDYDRCVEFNFILPYQFLLLCRLMDTTPEEVIRDFTDNLSCGSWNREGRDKAKEHLVNYFVAHGYGRHHYSEVDIRQMFREMDALGILFPTNGEREMVDLYAAWRDKHHTYWFEKRLGKPGRELLKKAAL